MHFRWLLAATLIVLPAAALAQTEPVRQAPSAQPAPAAPLVTNRRSFFIPVTVDRPTREHVPVEVHLLVSADQGKTWSTYARQGPDSKGFQFQARDDGEYWFASRTIDAQGKAKPSGDVDPELKIVIDGTQPKIELDAAVASDGKVKAAWRVSDATASTDSVKIDYQSGDALKPAWQQITLDPTAQKLATGMVLGEASFAPQATSRAIDVRIIVQDKAGNLATDVRRVFLPRESRVAKSTIPEWPPRFDPANDSPSTASGPNTSGDPFSSRQFGDGGTLNTKNASIPPPKSTPSPDVTSPRGTPWPADNKLPSSPTPGESSPLPNDKLATNPATIPTEPLARQPSEVAPRVTDRVMAKPSSTGGESPLIWPSDVSTETLPPPIPSASNPPPSSFETNPVRPLEPVPQPTNDYEPPREDRPTVADETQGDLEKPQLTSSKSFSLDYDIDSVGPSGVRAAELWVTVDGGRSWEKWGEDEDRQSPFEIQVQSERTFGFRMVIVANNGLATRSPEPGDPADIWISVDSTKPTARILQAGYGQGEHAGQLDIRWEASDEHLGPRPVSLSFSPSPDGPYTTFAAGLPNDGQYHWTIDPRTPRRLYLRIEVRDEAGNVTIEQTTEPISLEGLSPKGRIRAITPGAANQPPVHGAFRTPLFR